jgi:parallel beta-helix repeat protein
VKKAVLLPVFLLSLFVVVCFLSTVDVVAAQSSIYIRGDGTVDGTDEILQDGDVYTLTGDVFEQQIVIQKDNIVLDGANFALHGGGSADERGIDISNLNNVTVRNINVTGYKKCIILDGTTNSTVAGSVIDNEQLEYSVGVYLIRSSYNTITDNIIANNTVNGVYLHTTSTDNNVSQNTLTGNGIGLFMAGGEIKIGQTKGNTVTANNITNNKLGIYVDSLSINLIYHNNFVNNTKQYTVITYPRPDLPRPSIGSSWDNENQGNYWSDYNGTDNNGDGIGDTVYIMDEKNQDNYPLMNVIPEFPNWGVSFFAIIALLFISMVYKHRLHKQHQRGVD